MKTVAKKFGPARDERTETEKMEALYANRTMGKPGRPIKGPPQSKQITVTIKQLRLVYKALHAAAKTDLPEAAHEQVIEAMRILDRRTAGYFTSGTAEQAEAGANTSTHYLLTWPDGTTETHPTQIAVAKAAEINVGGISSQTKGGGIFRKKVRHWDDKLRCEVFRYITVERITN